jgi:hypothetical protein
VTIMMHHSSFSLMRIFERVGSIFGLANRGGSKTFIVAILHYANATFKPGCEGLQFGATRSQGDRCYRNIEDWCYEHDRESGRRQDKVKEYIQGDPMKSETNWKNGSRVEVVAGSESAVSGPHPQKAGADEIEQMEEGVWNQSRGMATAKKATGRLPSFMDRFNGMIPPQDIATSTMNSLHGRVKRILEEIAVDVNEGNIPEFTLIRWCIFETLMEVPNCRSANKEEREARLKALGRDPKELCACNRVVKGFMPDGRKRTLEIVCAGRAFRSRGWKPYIDFVTTFKRNTPGTWTLQHECRESKNENNYIEQWSLEFYGVRGYEPKPEFGPIYQGVDWGGTNPYAVIWFQYLETDAPAYDHNWEPIWIGKGGYVGFAEIYAAGIDTGKLAQRVLAVENGYRDKYGRAWRVTDRFCDPQGRGDRTLFARKGLRSSWPVVTRNKGTMITIVQNLVIDDRWAIDLDACQAFCDEIEVWQKNPESGKEIDKNNHMMSAWRYGVANAEVHHAPEEEENEDNNEGEVAEMRAKGRVKASGPKATDPYTKTFGPLAFRGNSRATESVEMTEQLIGKR